MKTVDYGNPIRLVTELIGSFHELVAIPAQAVRPGDAFHRMNVKLMEAMARQSFATPCAETNAAETCSKRKKIDAQRQKPGVVLDEQWEKMRTLYGHIISCDRDYSENRSYLVIGEAIALFEAVRDNVVISYLTLCSAGPLTKRGKQGILEAAIHWLPAEFLEDYEYEPLDAFPFGELLRDYCRMLQEGKPVDSTIQALEERHDLNGLFVDLVSTYEPDFYVFAEHDVRMFSDPERKLIALYRTKNLLMRIMPTTVRNELTGEQEALLSRIRDLRKKVSSLSRGGVDDPGAGLEIEEIKDSIKAMGSRIVTDAKEISGIENIKFSSPERGELLLEDYSEVLSAYNNRLYKLTVVGCGGLLEGLLKEFLVRRHKEVQAILNDSQKREQVMINAGSRTKQDDVDTWTLDALIRATDILVRDEHPSFRKYFDQVKRGRNTIHGGKADKIVADFSLTTVRFCLELLEKTPAA